MDTTLIQITVPAPQTVAVQATVGTPGVTVAAAQTPQTVVVAAAPTPQTVATTVISSPVAVAVAVTEAQPGAAGTSFTPVVLTLAAYLALTAPQQLDATKWYVIPA